MAYRKSQEDITRDILNKIRGIQESETASKGLLKEEKTSSSKAIAITDDPRFGQNTLTNQIKQFRSSVEGGAQFVKPSEASDVSECPLIYIPETGNLTFGGIIPCLNNLKFQFELKTSTGNGCFIWSDGLILNKENMAILNKLYGFYQNWKNSWYEEESSLEQMAKHFND